ncbi:MAG: P-loop NTPase [candidate division Zixibacteria bacterium]|nr:P-loop NTPase [candidate division Zixibacteria bacterium]
MRIAIASGKGGTGKTTVAVNLASLMSETNSGLYYVDCDVEEPNGHLFLNPEVTAKRPLFLPKPSINEELCDGCGECKVICQYNALALIGEKVLVFPELCHSCGGCTLACTRDAITEVPHEIGSIFEGKAGELMYAGGELKIGIPSAVPLIKEVKSMVPNMDDAILDAPAGTSCPVIETVRGADYVLLVTEPTPFGLNDLKIAVETVRLLGLPFGVVINRAGMRDEKTNGYCEEEGIKILSEIPNDRKAAEVYSRGQMLYTGIPGFRKYFKELFLKLTAEIESLTEKSTVI